MTGLISLYIVILIDDIVDGDESHQVIIDLWNLLSI